MNQRYYMGSGETRTGDFRKQAGLGSALYLAYKMRKKKEEDKYVKSDSASGQMMEHAASFGDIKSKSPFIARVEAYLAEEKAKVAAQREAIRGALAPHGAYMHPNPYRTMSARDMWLSTSEAARALDGTGINIYGLPPPDDNLNFKAKTEANQSVAAGSEAGKQNPDSLVAKLDNALAARLLDGMGINNIYGLPPPDDNLNFQAKTEANSHPNPYKTMPKGLEYFPIVPKLNPEDYKLKLPSQSNRYPPRSSGANQSVAAGSEAGKQNPDSLGAKLDNAIRMIKEQSRSFDSNHGTALRVGGGVAAGLLLAYMLHNMTSKKKKRRHEEAY